MPDSVGAALAEKHEPIPPKGRPSGSGTFWSVAQSGAPTVAAEEEVRAHMRQRVPRRINALNPWDGIEDDLPPLRRLIIHASRQSNCAEGNLGATRGPGSAGV